MNNIPDLIQEDYVVFATKVYSEQDSLTEGTLRRLQITLVKNHSEVEEYKTYVVPTYKNNKQWANIIKLLDNDIVPQLTSKNNKIRLKESNKKKKEILINADTPFEIYDQFPIDDFGNCKAFDYIDLVKHKGDNNE
jgi:hypothetical protein